MANSGTSELDGRVEQLRDQRTQSGRSVRLAVACLGFVLITLDATVVNVSLPSIGNELGGDVAGLQWVADAYTLMFAALLLSSGALADRVGASRAYLLGLIGFSLASVACGFAPGLGLLITARAVQGITAAVMLPSSLALVRHAYADATRRARAIAIWTAAGGAAVAAGPVAGGVLTSLLGWRSIFFLNVPLGVLAVVGTLRTSRSAPRPAPLDLGGQFTAALWMSALTYTVIEGGARGYGEPVVLGSSAAFVIGLTAFLAIEARSNHPMVPLRLFRAPTVSVCATVGFALNFTTYGLIFILSLYFQRVLDATPLGAGLLFLPMTALIMVVNMLSGRLTTRLGPKVPILLGQSVLTVGLLGLLIVDETTPSVALLLALVPIGIGAGMAVPPMTAALLDAVDAAAAGLASGILNAARQVGGALGVALFGALVAGAPDFVTGMHLSLAAGSVILVLTLTGSAAFLRSPERSPGDYASSPPGRPSPSTARGASSTKPDSRS
ncbi:MFS transporter [Flindersiella endophytica]